jgi:hypothetical protein
MTPSARWFLLERRTAHRYWRRASPGESSTRACMYVRRRRGRRSSTPPAEICPLRWQQRKDPPGLVDGEVRSTSLCPRGPRIRRSATGFSAPVNLGRTSWGAGKNACHQPPPSSCQSGGRTPCNVIERRYCHIKQWRGLATRYDKHATVYRAAVDRPTVAPDCSPGLFDRVPARHRS